MAPLPVSEERVSSQHWGLEGEEQHGCLLPSLLQSAEEPPERAQLLQQEMASSRQVGEEVQKQRRQLQLG